MTEPGCAFLDDDGARVRFAHVCNGEPKVDRLPNSVWTWDDAGRISPSIHCLACGFHEFLTLREKPALLDAMERAVGL